MTDSRLMLPVHEMAESFLPRIAGLDAGRELMASPALPRITVVAHPDELSAHAIAIHDLLDRVPDGRGLFYQPEWVRLMAPLFLQSGRRMHFLLAWRGERLIGMAPLVIEQRPWVRGHVRRVWFWGKVQGSLALEGDFLVPEATDVRPCARAFVAHLRGPSAPADYIELAYFRGASPCQVAFEAASHIAPEQIEPMVSHWAVLAPTFDAYCATLKKSVLGKVMNRLRAAERDLGAHLTCVSRLSADELEQVEALHVQRQRELAGKGRERHSLFEIPAESGIYHAMLETASQRGWARHYLLKSGEGRVLAFALCFHFAGTLFFHLTAFDSAHAKYEPGRVLMLLKIQAEIARGDTHHIDMMPGTTKIKEDFGNHVFSHRRYLAVNTGSLMSRLRCGVWQGQTAWLERLRALRSPRSAAEA
ncbi:Acetyltransferase (GNAT) domain-containing protein [Sphaerotilus natans]|nr:Acetyltransferase (GNAT) domain-containing protein [Sphaerotilus natans]